MGTQTTQCQICDSTCADGLPDLVHLHQLWPCPVTPGQQLFKILLNLELNLDRIVCLAGGQTLVPDCNAISHCNHVVYAMSALLAWAC